MNLLRKAHDLATLKIEEMKGKLEQYPEFKNQIEYNLKHYGVPFVSGSVGARWREDLVKDVRDLLYEEFPHKLVEVRIYPEDADGHHWGVEYSLLVYDEQKGFVKAIEYEHGKKGGDGNGGVKGSCFENLSE